VEDNARLDFALGNVGRALYHNTTGFYNMTNSPDALESNTTGNCNTADGSGALFGNTTGIFNIALGKFVGNNLTTGSNNMISATQVLLANLTPSVFGVSLTKTFSTGIRGVTTVNAEAIAVVVDSAGQLGTVSSSRRFKKEIKPMDKTSEAIMALKPVTFPLQERRQRHTASWFDR
jgi:hypothetical protein